MKEKIIYYSFQKVNFHFYINILLTLIMLKCFMCRCPFLCVSQLNVWTLICACSWLLWYWLYVKKHIMAIITDEGIKIDHCEILRWKDIKSTEEKEVRCCFKRRKVIILNIKDNVKYHYNYLQKNNPFTAFSIPLYGIVSDTDIKAIKDIFAKKIKKYLKKY